MIMPAAAKQLLMAGVTSARDLGAPLDAILHVRDAIKADKIPGPTLYVSGPFIQTLLREELIDGEGVLLHALAAL